MSQLTPIQGLRDSIPHWGSGNGYGTEGYVMRGERTSPRGVEYVQLILLERGEMTVRQISQRIRSLDTEAVRNQLDTLIGLREVESKQVGKKTVYYNVV